MPRNDRAKKQARRPAKKAKKAKPAGRPRGAKNVTTIVDVQPSRCPACGTTEKSYTGSRTVQDFVGNHAGATFTRVIRRRCICANAACSQVWIERTYEFEPAAAEKNNEQLIINPESPVAGADELPNDESV